jgi:hypothetical protein
MQRCVLLAILFIWSSFSAPLADEKPSGDRRTSDGDYQTPEQFHQKGRIADYLPHARQYLKDHPNDPRGPQIAMEMLMLSTTMNDSEGIKEAKKILIFQFNQSLHAGYVIRMANAGELNDLFDDYFNDKTQPLTKDRLKSFLDALTICYSVYGPAMADNELWAQSALAAPALEGSLGCKEQIKDPHCDAAKLLETALDQDLTARQKFVQLQQLKNSKTSKTWQEYLYTRVLSDSDRAEREVKKVWIENSLAKGNFAAALEHLQIDHDAGKDPQLLFWRGWAEAAIDKIPESIKTFDELARNHPDSPWSAPAKELSIALSSHSSNLKDHLAGLEEVYNNLRNQPPEVMQFDLEFKPEGDKAEIVQAHLGLDFSADDIDLLIKRAGKPLLGYTTSKLGLSFFCEGEDRIHHFANKGPFQWLYLNVAPLAGGAYHYGCNFNSSPMPGGLRNGIQTLIHSPALITDSARETFVRYQVKQGNFPTKVEHIGKSGERSFRWLMPQLDKPALKVFEIRLTSDSQLASLVWSDVARIENIHYGSSEKIALVEQTWPDLPVVESKEMGAPEMFRLIGAASQLFYPREENAPKAASNSQPIRR